MKGEFDNHGRPVIRAIFRTHVSSIPVAIPFLIDTGAVSTIIMPGHAAKLQVDCGLLPPPVPIDGIGGSIMGHPATGASITLIDQGSLYTFLTDVRIIDPVAYPFLRFPSILGRSVWAQWAFTVCHSTGQVDIDPMKNPDPP